MHTYDHLELVELPITVDTYVGDDFIISDNFNNAAPKLEEIPNTERFRAILQKPFKVKFTSLLICLEGEFNVTINLVTHHLTRGSVMLIPEGGIGEYPSTIDNCKIIMIAFTNRMRISSQFSIPEADRMQTIASSPMLQLDPDELADITNLYTLLRRRLSIAEFKPKNELFGVVTHAICCYIFGRQRTEALPTSQQTTSVAHIIYDRFMKLLGEHCREQHDLAFYANKLCLTPKYMSRAVCEASGYTAKRWIQQRIVLEAKILLNQPELTIQEISHRLGFTNQSCFGTFFRKATGLSPLAYRKRP